MFAGHDEGAAAWGRVASLIETAKLNGINPHDWLRASLEAIAASHPNSRDIVKHLKAEGFELASMKGSHHKFRTGPFTVVVPHPKKRLAHRHRPEYRWAGELEDAAMHYVAVIDKDPGSAYGV